MKRVDYKHSSLREGTTWQSPEFTEILNKTRSPLFWIFLQRYEITKKACAQLDWVSQA